MNTFEIIKDLYGQDALIVISENGQRWQVPFDENNIMYIEYLETIKNSKKKKGDE